METSIRLFVVCWMAHNAGGAKTTIVHLAEFSSMDRDRVGPSNNPILRLLRTLRIHRFTPLSLPHHPRVFHPRVVLCALFLVTCSLNIHHVLYCDLPRRSFEYTLARGILAKNSSKSSGGCNSMISQFLVPCDLLPVFGAQSRTWQQVDRGELENTA